MKIYLAGFNVDTTILRELQEKAGRRNEVTPEVISAAYARISRDPRPINEIREDARKEVERSRKSNSTIIFKMGHHSVAEHAVFNLDLIGASRYVMEEVEKFRLCSYTEKSQRYITLEKDFVVPEEIRGTKLEALFTDTIRQQNEAYFKLFERLKEYVFKKHADLAADPKNHNLLEGWAKEDARYITSLATESQVGMTVNARNLELLLRRFASHPLAEVQEIGRMIYAEVVEIAPSIVIFHQANDFDRDTYPQLKEFSHKIAQRYQKSGSVDTSKQVVLTEHTKDGDMVIAASLLHSSTDLSYEQCKSVVLQMPQEERMNLFKTAWRNMQLYDSMPREFEYANLTYDVVLSAACFGQLKRHRMTTITTQPYNPLLGITIPESIKETEMETYFRQVVDKTTEAYHTIRKEKPLVAPYILTNAHRRRVQVRLNVRELYHNSRVREDAHAQWDIRNLSCAMSAEAKKVMPEACSLIGSKDTYNETYKKVFGTLPKVVLVTLPGARKIKQEK